MRCIDTKDAVGHVLCHDITVIVKDVKKGVAFKKGHVVTEADIPELLKLGKDHLYVWEKDDRMLHEDEAAAILRDLCLGQNILEIAGTDDGSAGRQGVSTVPLKEMCESQCPPAEVIAIGPPIMMKFCALTTKPFNVPTTVSLNTIMIDGTGMCGGCRVSIGGETKFVCVDGPEFDAHQVDWDNMMMRMKSFKDRETEDFHKCKLQAQADSLAK